MLEEPVPTGDLIAGAIVGEYRVDKKIGEGGMGSVYSATHPMIGKRAAIKVISSALGTDASAVARFVQEARSVNQIGHPNIVDVFAFGELPDGRNYFVMEYLQGESLADRLGKGAMPLGEAIEILDQIADALEAAHEKAIVHRDLKPDNVYLAAVRGGRTMVKLLDFGIAKLAVADGPGSGGVQKTRTGMMMGTPGYLSPEQARGKNVDHRTDIYALGCMVFEVATGRLPFVADNAMDIVLMHMTEPPPRPTEIWPECPPPLDEIIYRMLNKDMAARPTLPEVRAVFSELITSGLVTLKNGGGVAFGSGIGRHQTGPGTMTGGAALATGTQPAQPGYRTAPPGQTPVSPTTQPPVGEVAPAPKKKPVALFAAIGVVLVGAVIGVVAMKGGSKKEPAPVAAAAPAPAPTPTPPPPPAEVKPAEVTKPAEPVAKTGGTIDISMDVDGASVTVDGNPIPVTGRKASAVIDKDGTHTIAITAAGHDAYAKNVDLAHGDKVMVDALLPVTKTASKTTTHGTSGTGGKRTGTGTAGTGAGSAKKTGDKNDTIDPFAN